MKMKRNMLKKDNECGNAMVYVLVALALIGFLTVTLSSQNDQADGQNLDDEMAELYAQELIGYASAAQNSIDMMLASGSEIDDLDFVNPSSAAFNTPPHYNKVFHPQGGGLNYQEKFSSEIEGFGGAPGWYILDARNVEWTPTIANDIILSSLRINKKVCETINKKITGSTAIPALTQSLIALFDPAGHTTDLSSTSCPQCEGYPAFCVVNVSGDKYGFYSIIAAQ